MLAIGGCQQKPPAKQPPRWFYVTDANRPVPTPGRVPAGTADDPFVGEGVIVRLFRDPEHPYILLKHKDIPNFMVPMLMEAPVPGVKVLDGIAEGMKVKVAIEVVNGRYQVIRILPENLANNR